MGTRGSVPDAPSGRLACVSRLFRPSWPHCGTGAGWSVLYATIAVYRRTQGRVAAITQSGLPFRKEQETHRESPPAGRLGSHRTVHASPTKAGACPGGCKAPARGAVRALAGGFGPGHTGGAAEYPDFRSGSPRG
jgi:hypothetical protein